MINLSGKETNWKITLLFCVSDLLRSHFIVKTHFEASSSQSASDSSGRSSNCPSHGIACPAWKSLWLQWLDWETVDRIIRVGFLGWWRTFGWWTFLFTTVLTLIQSETRTLYLPAKRPESELKAHLPKNDEENYVYIHTRTRIHSMVRHLSFLHFIAHSFWF
jgi:hypothetical protein